MIEAVTPGDHGISHYLHTEDIAGRLSQPLKGEADFVALAAEAPAAGEA
jgi:hypothetical protein